MLIMLKLAESWDNARRMNKPPKTRPPTRSFIRADWRSARPRPNPAPPKPTALFRLIETAEASLRNNEPLKQRRCQYCGSHCESHKCESCGGSNSPKLRGTKQATISNVLVTQQPIEILNQEQLVKQLRDYADPKPPSGGRPVLK